MAKKSNAVATTEAPKASKKTEAAPVVEQVKTEKAWYHLTGNEQLILEALAKSGEPMTRNDLRKATEIKKGYSKLLGATSKEDGGQSGDDSLEGRGFIKSSVPGEDEGRGFRYSILAKGRKALEAMKKAEAKAAE